MKEPHLQYGIPNAIVSDNKRQFNNERFRNFCLKLGIATHFTSPTHPQSNGQVEAVNKIVNDILKKKLEEKKGAWVDKLPNVLWAYQTTRNISTEEMSFSLAFRTDAILPVEIGMPSYKTEYFDEAENTYLIAYSLDLMAKKKKMS